MSDASHALKRLNALYGLLLRRMRALADGGSLARLGMRCHIELLPSRIMFSVMPSGREFLDALAPRPITPALAVGSSFGFTSATTNENQQSTSGLQTSGSGFSYVQITAISGGTLYQSNGTTRISVGDFITAAQGSAGMRFTPTANSTAAGTVTVKTSTLANLLGLLGSPTSATITVKPVPVLSAPATQAAIEDTPVTFSTTHGNAITVSDPGNASGTASLQLTGKHGNVTLSTLSGLTITNGSNNNNSITVSGTFTALNAALSGLVFTPDSSHSGSDAEVDATITEGSNAASKVVDITIAATAHTPTVSNATTNENQKSSTGLVITPNTLDAGLSAFYSITGITNGTLYQSDGVTPIANNSFITFAQGQAGLRFLPATNSIPSGSFTVQASTSNSTAGLGGSSVTASISVNPVPVVSIPAAQLTLEDTSLVFSGANGDALGVTDPGNPTGVVQLALVASNGTIALASTSGLSFTAGANASGSMTISGTFSAIAGALSGLSFTPASLYSGNAASIALTATEGSNSASATALITVARTAHTPSVSNATTNENQQSSAGLALTPSALDSGLNGFFKITGITGGTLFQNDGVTPISNGSFITFAQGQAGLRFTAATNSISSGSFTAQASTASADAGLGGSPISASIAVSPVPLVNVPASQATIQDTPLTLSTGNLNVISVGDPANPSGSAILNLSAQFGTITLAGMSGLSIVSGANGSSSLSVSGSFSSLNAALDGLVFTPASLHNGPDGQIAVSVSEGSNTASGAVAIDIQPTAHTATVSNAVTNENQQTTTGLIITPNALDTSQSGYFQITSIANGTLFQQDGSTPINEGDFITFAEGQAGLRFTPTTNSSTAGSFVVQTSLSANASGLAGQTVGATITVNPVPTLVVPAAQSTSEDTAIALSSGTATNISVVDPGNGGAAVQVNLSVGAGTLTLSTTAGLTFASGSSGAASMSFTGSLAQVNAALDGLTYSPNSHVSGSDTISVIASEGVNSTSGSVSMAVARVAHTPSVTNASTNENVQSTSGLVLSPATLDVGLTGYFKITGISGGTLFQNDGTTQIHDGDFISFAQGQAGLTFSPDSNSTAAGAFTAQASTSSSDAGLGGSTVQASVTVLGVPQSNLIGSQISPEDSALTFSAANANAISVSDPGAPGATVQVTLSATHGTIALGSLTNITVQNGNSAGDVSITFSGTIGAVNAAMDGAIFSPASHFSGSASVSLQATEGANSSTGTVAVTVSRIAHTPTVSGALTIVDQQSANGLVISPSALDAGLGGSFKITSIVGGTLYQHDGVTAINDGDFISFAQGQAGLRFTPTTNSVAAGSFVVQASTSASDAGLGGATASATITVDDPPRIVVSGAALVFTEKQGATPVDAALTLSDSDSATLTSATVRLVGYVPGEDIAQFANQNGITGSWNTSTATLTLSGTATVSDYQAALRSVSYLNNSDDPTLLARTFEFQASDGIALSAFADRAMQVVAVNDAPVLSGPAAMTSIEDQPVIFSSGQGSAITLSDVDADGGNEQVTVTTTNGTVQFSNGGSAQPSITLTGTLDQINAALNGLSFHPDSHWVGTTTLDISASDLGHTGAGGAQTVSTSIDLLISPASIVISHPGVVIQQSLPTTIDAVALQTTRADGSLPAVAYTVVDVPVHGDLLLDGVAIADGATFTQQDLVDGSLQYVPSDPAHVAADGFSVTAIDAEGATAGPVRVTFAAPAIALDSISPTPQTHLPSSVPGGSTVAPIAPQNRIEIDGSSSSAPASVASAASGGVAQGASSTGASHDGSVARAVVNTTQGPINANVVSGSLPRSVTPVIELAAGTLKVNATGLGVGGGVVRLDTENFYSDTLGDLVSRRRERWSLASSHTPAISVDSQLWRELDALHDEVTSTTSMRVWAGSASFASIGMSVIYFIWALRAGSLVSSLLSSMPAWKMVDPLPILDHGSDALAMQSDPEDKGLGDLVKGNG